MRFSSENQVLFIQRSKSRKKERENSDSTSLKVYFHTLHFYFHALRCMGLEVYQSELVFEYVPMFSGTSPDLHMDWLFGITTFELR
jgi:hypothetical protein